ncbi:hypothetical protein Scep_009535 [Stephania cephalantha]|uniref:Uncharacterized protein n=1 Tax=Stephania cephalantha TaxID=152367 RepID=A0AAP0PEF3_9MAGN
MVHRAAADRGRRRSATSSEQFGDSPHSFCMSRLLLYYYCLCHFGLYIGLSE